MRRILVIGLLLGVAACAGPFGRLAANRRHNPLPPVVAPPAPPPEPAQGLWAALDPGCAKPSAANIHLWPHCASPFWISNGKATVLVSGAASKRTVLDVSYAADYSLTPGTPLIAQVGTPKDGYVWLALTDLDRDDQGRLVGASGAAVPCAPPEGGELVAKPRMNGCDGVGLEELRKAAVATLQDHASLTKITWIAPGAPVS
ncbi:MAG TPA: hypothetical protein VN694_00455 [Caulobacteraceae bacterium]|nr:hypothetical protein [Caulobacteraceae bacterium]